MNPDEIPLPIAIPLAVVLWVIWLAPYARAARRRRRSVSAFYGRQASKNGDR